MLVPRQFSNEQFLNTIFHLHSSHTPNETPTPTPTTLYIFTKHHEGFLTSADIEDGKVEYDPVTKIKTEYKHIEGGYEVHKTIPQPNGTVKTQTQTFFDPKPCSEEDLRKEAENRKTVQQRMNKEVRIDKNTTMLTKAIEGGYEEIYTTTNADGTISKQTKTFFDSMSPEDLAKVQEKYKKSQKDKSTTETTNTTDSKKKLVQRNASVESTDASESRSKTVKKQQSITQTQDKHGNVKQQSTIEESRRVTENLEYTENNRTVRKNSVQEQHIRAVTQNTNSSFENKDTSNKTTKSKKKTKSSAPPPPADFVQNETTTIDSKKVAGGTEYTYSTTLETGEVITTKKIIYEEEVHECDEEEEQLYKKSLKDAEKHKNVTPPKKLKSAVGVKKIVPSENPDEVTTVEEIRVDGATEFHYTIVNAEGVVKKIIKTVYDSVATETEEYEEQEVIEDYEEEIFVPGEKNIRTIESIKQLPRQFEEEVTITSTQKKEKKVKKSTMITA